MPARKRSAPALSFPGSLRLAIFPENPENAPLNGDLTCRNVDRLHFSIRWLQSNHLPFWVKSLERCLGAADECDHDFSVTSRACPFDENIVATDDMFVAHGITPHL